MAGHHCLPESHLHVLDGINAKGVESGLLNPILVNLCHLFPHIGNFRSKIIKAAQLTQFNLLRVFVVLNETVVVKEIGERRVGGVEIKPAAGIAW